jgi:hypothetical protein
MLSLQPGGDEMDDVKKLWLIEADDIKLAATKSRDELDAYLPFRTETGSR